VDRALWFGQRHEASGPSHVGAAPRNFIVITDLQSGTTCRADRRLR
jgi:hypothetical protein